jgi:hypothetical protein
MTDLLTPTQKGSTTTSPYQLVTADEPATQSRTIIGLDLNETAIRLVIMTTTEDSPLPTFPTHQTFRSKEKLQRYFATLGWDEEPLVAVSGSSADPHEIIEWLSTQEGLTLDWHGHPEWSSIALDLNEEMEFWELPRSYKTAYALVFLSSYRLHARSTAHKLWNQVDCLNEIVNEFKVELQRLSHALSTTGLLESQKKGLCPF